MSEGHRLWFGVECVSFDKGARTRVVARLAVKAASGEAAIISATEHLDREICVVGSVPDWKPETHAEALGLEDYSVRSVSVLPDNEAGYYGAVPGDYIREQSILTTQNTD